MAAKTSRADFESVFPSLVEDLKEAAAKYNLPKNAMDWFVKVLQVQATVKPLD